ncbi:MAG: carbohydrate kinase [Treponema sp.]|jgi:L-xylulokinase|nr:carbohydrate kinase [Treponema sp.]
MAGERFVLGVDNGGTVIKAALFSLDGKEIATASRQTAVITPRSGYTERDMDNLWEQNCACIRQVIAGSGVSPASIAGLAVCGHGKGLYPWGRDGKPAYNGIISTDNRAWQYPEKWKREGSFDAVYPRLCQQIMACQPVSLLAWFKEHDRAVYDNIKWAFSVTDYVRFRLTGEAWSEATNISGSALMNVRDASIDRDLLAALGIEEAAGMIPPLRYSSEHCGAVTAETAGLTGLVPGTPVAGGMFDIDSCAIAMSVTRPEHLCTITGTWSINEFISGTPVTGTCVAMNSLYAIPGFYLLEESSATSAGNLEWVIQNCFENEKVPEGKKLYQYLDELAGSVPPDSCDVYFLPFLYGSNRHPLAKASFIGLTSFHGKAHLLRSVFEGVVFSAKSHIDKLLSIREAPEAVRLAGGAANSRFWVQMFADVLELPVETVTGVRELGALGCGMAAAVASGIYRDYNEAAEAMVRISPPVFPNPENSALYRPKYEKYTALCEALDTVWNRFEV